MNSEEKNTQNIVAKIKEIYPFRITSKTFRSNSKKLIETILFTNIRKLYKIIINRSQFNKLEYHDYVQHVKYIIEQHFPENEKLNLTIDTLINYYTCKPQSVSPSGKKTNTKKKVISTIWKSAKPIITTMIPQTLKILNITENDINFRSLMDKLLVFFREEKMFLGTSGLIRFDDKKQKQRTLSHELFNECERIQILRLNEYINNFT